MNPLELVLPAFVRVVFFDMDHTLVANDSDVSWKAFLADRGLAGLRDRIGARWHYRQYRRGRLNQAAFTRFQYRQFVGKTPEELAPLFAAHSSGVVLPRLYSESRELVRCCQETGREVVLLTATSTALAAPTAEALGIAHCIGSPLELVAGRYTGRLAGTYCGGAGKLEYIDRFLAARGLPRAAASYWGDAAADILVLAAIGHPVAANPVPALQQAAAAHGWPVVRFTMDTSG
jgi:HAD superfamily hydrolase (TIGR01490 family)